MSTLFSNAKFCLRVLPKETPVIISKVVQNFLVQYYCDAYVWIYSVSISNIYLPDRIGITYMYLLNKHKWSNYE
jgi:hypothetical protein